MKRIHSDPNRRYRDSVAPSGSEVRFQVAVEQTDLLVVAREDLSRDVAGVVSGLRGAIKNHILFHPEFAESLAPLDPADSAPEIVRAMAAGAAPCGVGPMAAVAGTVAEFVAREFASRSPDFIVENGGDIFMYSTRDRVVALLPDPDSGSSVGIRLAAERFPLSVCSSSATIGHSLSLGAGDLVTVAAKSGALADAAATALCNMLRNRDSINDLLAEAERLSAHGLEGVFAQVDGQVAAWGDVELVAV